MPSTQMSASEHPALALEGITCTFISRDDPSQRYTAVRESTLRIAPGEFVSVVGPTGCGKSTLLNVGAGLLSPSSGQVRVFGEPLSGINRRAGYMFQGEALLPWRCALDNVITGLEFAGVERARALDEGRAWMRRVGLGGFEDRYPHQMSGGMRKRTMLAQTLIRDPDIILMDEPFSALDIQTRQLMENEVLELWMAKRKAVLFITHDRPRRGAFRRARNPSDRRVPHRPAAPARCGRGTHATALHRVARRNLVRPARRSA